MAWQRLKASREIARKIARILCRKVIITIRRNVISNSSVIRCSQVSKNVSTEEGPISILEEVNFQVNKAESVAVIGQSGSGKTTLLSLLAGLDVPTTGSIELFHHKLEELSEDERAQLRAGRVAFIFQSFQLLQHLTAYENVLLSMEILGSSKAKEKTLSILERVGLSHRLEHYPNQLSGGEQQRCAIARAFVIEPILLFADEPTGNLDLKTGQTVVDLLIATHDSKLASKCDRIITLSGGEVLSDESNLPGYSHAGGNP